MANGLPDVAVCDGQGRLTSEGFLCEIENKASTLIKKAEIKISEAEQGEKMQGGDGAMDSTYAGLCTDILAVGSGVEGLKMLNDGLAFLEDRSSADIAAAADSPCSSGNRPTTFDAMCKEALGATPLERINITGKSLCENSSKDGANLASMDTPTKKFGSVQEVCKIQWSLEKASELTLQQVAAVRAQQSMMRNGPGMGLGSNGPSLNMDKYAPVPPKFAEVEESEHSWAGIESA